MLINQGLKMSLAVDDSIIDKESKKEKVASLEMYHNVICYENNEYTAEYKDLKLSTAIQPIYSIDHQKIIGYEALIRAHDANGSVISPIDLFNMPTTVEENVYLDRLCRYTHAANFEKMSDDNTWFFINVSALASECGREYGLFLSELLKYFNIKPHNVVVEIIEDPTNDHEKLLNAIDYYKNIGCMLAIDDFGAGHSNFERVWSVKPDIVKLDRSMITRNVSNREANILPSIVELLHQAGCLVVAEGIETETEALVAMNSGADFVQGYYFAKPGSMAQMANTNRVEQFKHLTLLNIKNEKIKKTNENKWLEPSIKAFNNTIEHLKSGDSLEIAILNLYSLSGLIRCYLLNDVGEQMGETLKINSSDSITHTKFKPLQSAKKANWYRKAYVRSAINNPHRINISSPYRSITGDGLCITLSLYFENNNKDQILCFDILPE